MALSGKAADFLALHVPGRPLLQPNAYDAGSARLLAAAGFAAVATTSSGFAATLGRRDGGVSRDEALAHFATLSAAVDVAVAADAENAFAHEPAGVAETIRLAGDTGLAGISVEDYDRDGNAIYDRMLAVDRVTAAVEAARAANLVLTARAESLLHGGTLAEAVTRVELFVGAGADVVFVPGVRAIDDIDAVVQAAGGTPVNVLVLPGCPTVAELAELGVARISVGGAFTWAAYAAVLEAAQELRDEGTYSYVDRFSKHRQAINDALR